MATYAIGDVQGCFDELLQIFEAISFSPKKDTAIFLGDLVNRGPKSLEVLRFVRGLGEAAQCVLGNHDLHLLAVASGVAAGKKDTFGPILESPDRDALLAWLASQPLALRNLGCGTLLVHAGIAPQWSAEQTLALASEAGREISRAGGSKFLGQMYGDQPAIWSDDLRGTPRIRFIVNCLTRMRFCDSHGALNMKLKGPPGSQPPQWLPWFAVAGRKTASETIAFGHWSSLGRIHWPEHKVWGLDTGCVWGRRLTALCLESGELRSVPSSLPPAFGESDNT